MGKQTDGRQQLALWGMIALCIGQAYMVYGTYADAAAVEAAGPKLAAAEEKATTLREELAQAEELAERAEAAARDACGPTWREHLPSIQIGDGGTP